MQLPRRLAGLLVATALAAALSPVAAGASRPAQAVGGLESAPGVPVPLLAGPAAPPTVVPPLREPGEVSAQSATITVNYSGFTPQAQAAFQYAVDLWEQQITSSVPIEIDASFTSLGFNVLGQAGPNNYFRDGPLPVANTWYPSALTDALVGVDVDPGQPDAIAAFNSGFANWYFGTDGNAPPNTYDFVTVVLHELGHALGFQGTMDVSGANGLWGLGPPDPTIPAIYDRFTENLTGTPLLDASFGYNTPALKSQLVGGGNGVFFDGPATDAADGGNRATLYSPNPWQDGSSYSHLDEATYPNGNPNSLMTPILGQNEVIHDPGPVTRGMFTDMGWSIPVVPGAPTAVVATAGSNEASVAFDPPASDGGSTILSYTVTSSGGQTATGTSSPIHVAGLTNGTPYTFTVTAANVIGTGPPSAASDPVTPGLDGFVPLDPVRILDTRFGTSTQCPTCQNLVGARGPASQTTVHVEDSPQFTIPSPVPADANAVVLNATATAPTKAGWLTVWDAGDPPTASNLNFVAGETVPNLVTVKLAPDGTVQLGNSLGLVGAGTVQVVFDVVGYYTFDVLGQPLTATTPNRILDTRFGTAMNPTLDTPLGPQDEASVQITGLGVNDVPADATAVVMNVTATGPGASGWLTIWPEGAAPTASNLNFVAGQTVPNLVTVKLAPDGTVQLGNTTPGSGGGPVDVIFDVVGWIGPNATDGGLTPITPVRILDTRFGVAGANARNTPLNPQERTTIQVAGYGGVPATGVGAVLLNVTATGPTKAGWLTLWPQGSTPPTASNLNFVAGQTVPNLVLVKLAPDGTVRLGNSYLNTAAGTVNVIFDVVGWFATPPLGP